jgi:aminoglycoside/choline kinase family phosphotransferase
MHPSDAVTREQQRLAWARRALGDPTAALVRASVDAGFRSYWRSTGSAQTRIVMDSPPDKEDVAPWLRIRTLLEGGGVRVPQVLAEDVDTGFLLLEDLGVDTDLQVIDAGNADALFEDAITQLLRLQAIPPPLGLPAYDEALLARELHLFDEWFVGRHLGLQLDSADVQTLEHAYRLLTEAALAQPRVLVHRDFMPRNLMPATRGPAVLDFQDAVSGPIAYDAMSLFKDAFLSWPQSRVDAWLDRYHRRATDAGLPVPPRARFRRDADWIGIQRHLKVIGIFARLWHRDAKPKYLADVRRFFGYLDGVLPQYEEFAPLHELIDRAIRPAMASVALRP